MPYIVAEANDTREMKSFSIAFLLVSTAIALQCTQYAEVVFGDVKEVKPKVYNMVKKSVGEFGVAKDETCKKGEQCVGDTFVFTSDKGQRAGLVWTSCKDKFDIKKSGECYWYKEDTFDKQFRCSCARNNCQSVKHLTEQFTWAHGAYIKP